MNRSSVGVQAVFAAIVFLPAALFAVGSAHAQTADCSCLVPQTSIVGGPIGQLMDVSGSNVTLSGSSGPSRAIVGAPLRVGDTLTVGPASSAAVVIGDCSLRLDAQTEMTVASVNSDICVAVDDTGASTFGQAGPLILGGVAVGGAAAIILSLGSDSPASP